MHAYLDAIYHSRSAIILYPGEVYRFYLKAPHPTIFNDVMPAHELHGVGAIPLNPSKTNDKFDEFIKKYFHSSIPVISSGNPN